MFFFLFLVIVVIVIFLIFGFVMFKKYWKLKKYTKNFKKIKGICTEDNRFFYRGVGTMDEDRGVKSKPYIAYTVENRQYEVLSKITYGGIGAFLTKGRKFTVYYNPNNPYDAILKNELSFYFQMFSFCFFVVLTFFNIFINVLFNSI